MAECAQCGEEFTPAASSRKDQKFCSARCRVSEGRNKAAVTTPPVTRENAKAVTLTPGGDPRVTTLVNPGRKPPGNGFPPGYDGEHAGHQLHPHHHVPVDGKQLFKPCSGRWFCETCRGDLPGTWFSATACFESEVKAP